MSHVSVTMPGSVTSNVPVTLWASLAVVDVITLGAELSACGVNLAVNLMSYARTVNCHVTVVLVGTLSGRS